MRTSTPCALRVLAVVAILMSPAEAAASPRQRADDAPSGTFDDVVTVAGTRIEVPLGTSGRAVEVLTREEIAAHGVRSVPELLQLFPGLDVRRRGVYGVQAAGRWHDDLFILDRHDPDLLTNRHEDRSLDLQVRAVRETPAGTVQAGTGWVAEDLDSTNLGNRERQRWGSFAALVGERGRWGWRGAVHADRVERSVPEPGADREDWEVHPALALSVRAAGGRFRASAASAYRLPSFTELHYRDPASVGDPDLEPEHSWTYEVGYDRVRGVRRFGATLFERRGRDLIDFVRAPVGLDWGLAASYNQRHEGDAWGRLDVRLARGFSGFPVGSIEAFVEVENLTDERYVERGEIEMPGRWAVAGIRLGAW